MGTLVIRTVSTQGVALYSAMFAAFVLCALLPTQLIYLPSQLAANLQEGHGRSNVVPSFVGDIRRGWPIVLLAALVACGLSLPLAREASATDFFAASAGLVLLTVASPFQTHMRACLHLGGRHGGAAVVSVLTLIIQLPLSLVSVQMLGDQARFGVVIGVLLSCNAVANVVASVMGLRLMRDILRATPTFTAVRFRLGVLLSEAVSELGLYLAILITALILGSNAVAELEAARVTASPAQVLIAGLLTYAVPQGVRAVARGDTSRFRRLAARSNAGIILACLAYATLAFVASSQIGSLLDRHVDKLLVVVRVLVTGIYSCGSLAIAALLAQRKVLSVNTVVVLANLVTLVSMPLALLTFGTIGTTYGQGLGALMKATGASLVLRRAIRAAG